MKKLLMISMDRNIFDKTSAVAQRQIEYAKNYKEVHIIIFSDKTFTETTLGTNIFVYPTRSAWKYMKIFDALRLGRFIVEKRGIDSVTCQDPFETGLVGMLIKNRHPVSLEIQVHTDLESPNFKKLSRLNGLRLFISKFTLRKADHVRVVMDRIKTYLSQFIDPSKIEVRPVVIDSDKIKNSPINVDLHKKYPQFSKIVLMMSRLEREKDIGIALRAFKIVLEKIPQVGLVIVGSGREEVALKTLARDLGIQNSVIFEGWQKDTVSYLKTSDLLLNTSLYEGYGMTLKEAEAINLKTVSTDVGIAREIGAKIVEPKAESIAHGIITTIN